MPIELNEKMYSLGLFDTGIISAILKNSRDERLRMTHLAIDENVIPSFSIWSILEIRRRPDLYAIFLELFSVFPFFLLRDPYNLLQDELDAYPDPVQIQPVAFAFSPFNPNPDSSLGSFMAEFFSRAETKEAERRWNGPWTKNALASMLSLRKNFSPKGDRFNADDGARFVKLGGPQYLLAQAPEWVEEFVKHGNVPEIDAFPSVKMAFYNVFYRFYAEDREPEHQNVFDILIGGFAPYVDAVFTERFQAEIYRKVARRDELLAHLRIETIDAFR